MSQPHPSQISRYQVLKRLGKGGMGDVYLAQDPGIDRLVAIKRMSVVDDQQMLERFKREAKAVGRLRHPNIVTIFDVGEEDGAPFIVMEYVEGETLSDLIRRRPDTPVARKLEIMEAICAGLYYAHRSGVVHRDIKPPNIMVDPAVKISEGGVKILDFGIARGPASGMTQIGTVMGTLNYMAPEQLAGKRVDHRADIYAVGAVFYELLTGNQAFPGDIQSGVLHNILYGQPEPLARLLPGLNPQLVLAVERCLHKDPTERYDDLEMLRRDVAELRPKAWQDELNESTLRMPKLKQPDVGTRTDGPKTPGPTTKAQLVEQRRKRIEQMIAEGRAALDKRNYAAALEACDQVLIIDDEQPDVLRLLEQVRATQQAEALAAKAQAELSHGALAAASALVQEAIGLAPDLPEVIAVRDAVAVARRKAEEEEARSAAVRDTLALGRQRLAAGEFDRVMAVLSDLARLDPGNAEAAQLSRDLEAARLAKARADEDARAKREVDEARQMFEQKQYDRAIARLRDYRPAHPHVMSAIATFEKERTEIERRERELEARRQAEVEARKAEEAARLKARKDAEEAERRAEAERQRLAKDKAEQEQRDREQRERERRAAEAETDRVRAIDAQRRADDERKTIEARQAREREQAEEKRRAEDARRAEEQKKAEAARLAKERQDRERSEAEARRKAEEALKAKTVSPPIEDPKTVILKSVQPPPPHTERPSVSEESKTVLLKTVSVPAARPTPAPRPAPPVTVPPVPVTPDTVPPATTVPGIGLNKIAIGAAALVVLLLIGWGVYKYSTSGGPGPGPVPGLEQVVTFQTSPWIRIEAITRTSDNTVVLGGPWTTPCLVRLPPGQYRVKAGNPLFDGGDGKGWTTEFDVTIEADKPNVIQKSFLGLKPEDEARKILGLPPSGR